MGIVLACPATLKPARSFAGAMLTRTCVGMPGCLGMGMHLGMPTST